MKPLLFPLLFADKNASFWFPAEASTFAREVDGTYMMIFWISLAFFIAVVWYLFYFAYRYQQAKGGKATSRATHNTVLEVGWSVGPSFLLVLMFVRGTWAYLDMKEPPTNAVTVQATAKKWSWLFSYPGGISHPELHVVKDQATRIVMRSQDVLHAFYVPAFRVKQDIVPGRYNLIWFTPTIANGKVSDEKLAAAKERHKGNPFDYKNEGFTEHGYEYYDLYCAEYCGQDHSQMQTVVVVHETQEDLNNWLTLANVKPAEMSMEAYGEQMYNQRGCASCHSVDGSARTGPSFKDTFGTARSLVEGGTELMDENYVRESILNPRAKVVAGFQPVMPTFKGQLTDEQIDSLIAFIKSKSAPKK